MVYQDLFDADLYLNSLKKCRKNVSWKYSVQKFSMNKFSEIYKLIEKLKKRDFSFPEYREFDICERGKKRHIKAVSLEERILQKVLCQNYLIPLLSKSLIYDNSATLKGKGVSFARKRIVNHLAEYYRNFKDEGYVLQIDFKNYFGNINHKILFAKLNKIVKDAEIFNLLKVLISKSGSVGLGIGSELSQILAVWYPDKLDHFCKEVLRLRYYARYMDDIYAFHISKSYLEECLNKIEIICNLLDITINKKKTHIKKIKSGFTFLKVRYRFLENGKILKATGRDSCKREKGKFNKFKQYFLEHKMTEKEIKDNYKSWRNPLKKFNCHNLLINTDKKFNAIFGGKI